MLVSRRLTDSKAAGKDPTNYPIVAACRSAHSPSQPSITAALAAPAPAQQNADWTRPFPAFKLIGNVYWVGTYDLSTYLITSGDGHILINTGFPETVPQIRQGVEKLGFKLGDVKVLLATHAHGDHVAGLAELKRLTAARVMMMEPDAALLEDGGRSDFRFGDEPGTRFDHRWRSTGGSGTATPSCSAA